MPNGSIKVSPPSTYLKNCIKEVAHSVYGRDNRVPIHDVLAYLVNTGASYNTWTDELGLIVENGKLCVVYDPNGSSDEPYVIPSNIQQALAGILTDVYGNEVRQDIVDSFQWAVESIHDAISFERKLGLTVSNGKLCVVYGEDEEEPVVPPEIESALTRILTGTNGLELREDIVEVLQWGLLNSEFSGSIEEINDIGIKVVDGKLCIEYHDEN